MNVYERGRDLSAFLARKYGVRPFFFWQPVLPRPAEVWASRNVSPPTVNISEALDDHRQVFIDGSHTNGEGAKVVAERVWREISTSVRDNLTATFVAVNASPINKSRAPRGRTHHIRLTAA